LGRSSRRPAAQPRPTHLKIARDHTRPPIRASRVLDTSLHPPPTLSPRRRIFSSAKSPPKTPAMPLLPARARRAPAALLVPARGLLEARVPWVRDRALDHAVEREHHLVPFLLTKDALLAAAPPPHVVPLHSLPSTIPFPFRPLRFLRLYASAARSAESLGVGTPRRGARRRGAGRRRHAPRRRRPPPAAAHASPLLRAPAPPRRPPPPLPLPQPPTASCGCSCREHRKHRCANNFSVR